MLWLCTACYYPGNICSILRSTTLKEQRYSVGQSAGRVQVGRQKPGRGNI